MLHFVRAKQKSIIIKLAFAIIILSFVIGYAMLTSPGDSSQGGQGGAEAATVNGSRIAYDDFQRTYGNLFQLYKNIYQDQLTPALEKQLKLGEKSIDSLIDQALLQEEATRQKIEISEKELVDAIAAIPAFQDNGAFNKERYMQVLAYQRMDSEQFEQLQRSELIIDKVRQNLQAGVTVGDADVEQEFRNNEEKLNLNFVGFVPASFESKVKVSEDALQAFFKEQQETFRVPEMVSLRYLEFDPRRYVDQVTFEDAELEKFYRRHIDRFEVLERVKASHILVMADAGMDEATRAKKRAHAEKLLEQARAGKDFAELARLNSDDKASAVNGGSLGYFTRGSMVKPFEEAAFALKPGDLSGIVETTFGYHIIKVEEHVEPGIRSLADAMAEVKEGLRAEKAGKLAYEKAMDAYNINRKSGDLAAAAKANDLGIKESGAFDREGVIDGIGRNEEIAAAAFLLDQGALAKPVVTDRGVILFGLKQRIPSRLPELAEVRDMVESGFRMTEAVKLARAAATELAAAAAKGGSLAALAKQQGYKLEETGEFSRTYSPFVPRLGSSEELFKAAFELGEGKAAPATPFELSNRFVVVELKERVAADMTKLDEAKRAELKKSLLARRQNDAVDQRMAEMRKAATIIIDPRVQDILDKEK